MIIRDYQADCVGKVFDEWLRVFSTLVVCPTGCGKTRIACEIIHRIIPKNTLFIAHRAELIYQTAAHLKRLGIESEIEMADQSAVMQGYLHGGECHCVVSTVQTQCAGKNGGRMTKFRPTDFDLVVIDEGHHATASQYKKIIEYYRQNPNLKILGLTATPDRADKEALGQVFETVAFDYEILDAIDHGWLVPVTQQMVEVEGLDFSKIRTTAGDLNGGDLAEVMEYEANLHGIADPTLKIVADKKTLVFAASVAHAERLCEIFNRHKPGIAGFVSGETIKEERAVIFSRFRDGDLQILCNCAVATEGFDAPECSVIAMAKPTKSRSLYAQMAGRAIRPLPGVVDGHEKDTSELRKNAIAASNKPSCLIIDFVGNSGRHKLMTTADILGGNFSDEAVARAEKEAQKAGVPVNMADAISRAETDIATEREQKKLRDEAAAAAEAARRARIKADAMFSTHDVNPFDRYDISPGELAPRNGEPCTEPQAAILRKYNINPARITKRQASGIIGKLFSKGSPAQVYALKKRGYADADKFTAQQVREAFNESNANNGRKPEQAAV